jgi:lambda repressor-like predicted transcriptional regulator
MNVDLRAERRNRGKSVAGFAEEIGVPYHVLRDAEKGTVPRGDNAVRIAAYFDTTVTEMWPEREEAAA